MSIVILVEGEDDWDGLYIDGRLAFENHTIPVWMALTALKGVHITDLFRYTCDSEWLEEQGSYPDEFGRIPTDALV